MKYIVLTIFYNVLALWEIAFCFVFYFTRYLDLHVFKDLLKLRKR